MKRLYYSQDPLETKEKHGFLESKIFKDLALIIEHELETFMEFAGWDIIITLLIATYGAVLSTYSAWTARQEHKREIKAQLAYGMVREGYPPTVSTVLIISALNPGEKTVTLSSTGLILPNKKHLAFLEPRNLQLPHDLPDGKSCSTYIDTKELAEELRKQGYSGKVKLIGYYGDALGERHKSKSLRFDIDKP